MKFHELPTISKRENKGKRHMERLTKYVKSQGEYVIDCKCKSCDTCKENILDLCSMQDKVIQKCGEYENTGLTPQEVEKLVKENAELKSRLEKAIELPL